jgi:hypothetical protein
MRDPSVLFAAALRPPVSCTFDLRIWSARTRPRFGSTRHVASKESDVMPSHSTPIAPIVHPKMNSGKEPFKCGMGSAEREVIDQPSNEGTKFCRLGCLVPWLFK